VLRLWSGSGTPEAERFATTQLRLAGSPAISAGDVPTLGAWVMAGADLAAHRGELATARELWALAMRLGARVVYPLQEGYRPPLLEALGDTEQRVLAMAPWRTRSAAVVATRARELMTALLA
jgi:hypothetical protein